ncbi:hypothetical protein EDB84DRAFT_1572036 [Lactarius hengduanensis]|nr:hypothetical protein EDB84DRAFT_1572036 [Lactarius hengduanensis]
MDGDKANAASSDNDNDNGRIFALRFLGSLTGHSNWVTAIATFSETPDVIPVPTLCDGEGPELEYSIRLPKTPAYAVSGMCRLDPPTIPHALPISIFSFPDTSPLAAPSSRCTLPPSDRVIPTPSPVHWYMQHPSQTSSAAVRLVPIIGRRGPLEASSACSQPSTACLCSLSPRPTHADPDLTRQQYRPLKLMQQRGISHAPDPDRGLIPHAPSPAAYTDAFTALDAFARAVQTSVTSVYHTDLVVAALGHHADLVAGYVNLALVHLRSSRHMEVGNQDLEAYKRPETARAAKAMEAMLAGGEPTGHRILQLPRFSHCMHVARRRHRHRTEEQDPADCRWRSLSTRARARSTGDAALPG